MIPSRGLRWSSQTIGIGRRRLENLSARSFSSATIPRGPASSTSLLSQHGATVFRGSYKPQLLRTSTILQHPGSRRFASTSPISTNTTTSTTDAITAGTASNPEIVAGNTSSAFDSAIDLSSSSLLDIPEHIGYLKSLGLDYGWGPTAAIEWLLEHVHVLAGTPWWASISITAIIVRILMFKPYMDAADNAARLATCAPITKPMTAQMQELTRQGDSAGAMALRAEVQRIHKRAGIVFWKSFVPIIQMFTGYGTFILLRGMGRLPVPGLETGGALWFQNLAVSDPLFLLPLATAGVLHWVLRKGGETGVNTMSPAMVKGFSYGLPAITLAFTAWLPAGLQLSFLVSGVLSYLQSLLFRNAAFRSRFGMHPLPSKPVDPFTKPAEKSPYQDRIVVLPKSEYSYQTPEAKYEAPRGAASAAPKSTILSGFKKEFSSAMEAGKEVAKSARETLNGGAKKEGKRTKAEIRAAEKYEEERRAAEKKRILEADERRRQERLQKRHRH